MAFRFGWRAGGPIPRSIRPARLPRFRLAFRPEETGRLPSPRRATGRGKSIGLEGGSANNTTMPKWVFRRTPAHRPASSAISIKQGALGPNYAYQGQPMNDSQNGRGGTFYVLDHPQLFKSLTDLLSGQTAPCSGPNGK